MNTQGMKWKDCVDKGWHPIVEEAVNAIEARGGFIRQVKEKFGGLRIYSHGGDQDAISDVVHNAEQKAGCTCERCGQPGRLFSLKGWYKTVCDECRDKEV